MKKKTVKTIKKVDLADELLKKRQIFIYSKIDSPMARDVTQRIMYLDSLNHKPITIWINSGGGCVSDGFAIIDIMQAAKSQIITIVSGEACSMAATISIAGDIRKITSLAIYMLHDMAGGIWGDYASKVKDRAKAIDRTQKKLFDYLKKYTNLTSKELEQAKHGELWLSPEECLKKGIVEEIIGGIKLGTEIPDGMVYGGGFKTKKRMIESIERSFKDKKLKKTVKKNRRK